MARVVIKLKVMPAGPDTDMETLTNETVALVKETYGDQEVGVDEQPFAFGLKVLMLTFSFDEDKGSTDALEEQITTREDVQSCEVASVSRALG